MAQPSTADLRALARRDPALGRAMRTLETCPKLPLAAHRGLAPYEYLARAITFQQLSGKAAETIWKRACALGDQGEFPRPDQIARLSDPTLRSAGLSRQKILALRDLAQHEAEGRLPWQSLRRRDDEAVIEALTAVRGIGRWSAQMFLMFRWGRLDVLAGGDLGLQEGLKQLDNLAKRPTPKALLERGAIWAPLRSIASWYLWRLAEAARSTER
jgi:DNA-3-methyladenine glycosylase II